MHYSGLALKLRGQIHDFSGKLSPRFSKPKRRFVEQMIYGIQAKGDVKLSEIARSLNERIALLKTETRLSRNLSDDGLEESLLFDIAKMGARRVHRDTLLLIDPTDVRKDFAKKMEHLAFVRDGSTGEIVKGYWMCEVVACECERRRITPLYQSLYSADAPGFVSENDEIMKAVDLISTHTKQRGVWVMDRGGSRKILLDGFLDRSLRFIIRLRSDFHLMFRGARRSALEIAAGCPIPYSEAIVKEQGDEQKGCTIHFGFRPVRVPGRDEQMYLVVIKGFGEEPLMLLTNLKLKRTRKSIWFIVGGYLTRWRIEDTIRFIKQSYRLEDIRVRGYRSLKNLVALALCAAYFAAVHLGEGLNLQVLTHKVIRAAKRIFGVPAFHYYAIADGIAAILSHCSKGPLCASLPPTPTDSQQWLFDIL
jgi:hypothetical protein